MKWRVMVRTGKDTVGVWMIGLTQDAAECMASVLRTWMPRTIFSAWVEPDWESAEVAPMKGLARHTSTRVEKVTA